MSVSAAVRYLGESDKRLWRVVNHYVTKAHADKDWSGVKRIMIDEPQRSGDSLLEAAHRVSAAKQTSARRGHRYVTVVLDADSKDLLLMGAQGSTAARSGFDETSLVHPG